jgi:sulfopyruvate decarboxylase TPP-binding subunit
MDKFKFISTIKKKNIDIYIFIICNNLKGNLEHISKILNLENIPKKIFDDCNLKSNFEKKNL